MAIIELPAVSDTVFAPAPTRKRTYADMSDICANTNYKCTLPTPESTRPHFRRAPPFSITDRQSLDMSANSNQTVLHEAFQQLLTPPETTSDTKLVHVDNTSNALGLNIFSTYVGTFSPGLQVPTPAANSHKYVNIWNATGLQMPSPRPTPHPTPLPSLASLCPPSATSTQPAEFPQTISIPSASVTEVEEIQANAAYDIEMRSPIGSGSYIFISLSEQNEEEEEDTSPLATQHDIAEKSALDDLDKVHLARCLHTELWLRQLADLKTNGVHMYAHMDPGERKAYEWDFYVVREGEPEPEDDMMFDYHSEDAVDDDDEDEDDLRLVVSDDHPDAQWMLDQIERDIAPYSFVLRVY